MNFEDKIFNDDLNASHYLYTNYTKWHTLCGSVVHSHIVPLAAIMTIEKPWKAKAAVRSQNTADWVHLQLLVIVLCFCHMFNKALT